MAHLLDIAFRAFDEHTFERCEQLCDEILAIDAFYSVALELRMLAENAALGPMWDDYAREAVSRWRAEAAASENGVPCEETVRCPSAEAWGEMTGRCSQCALPCRFGVFVEVEAIHVDLCMESATPAMMIAQLRRAGVHIDVTGDLSFRRAPVDLRGVLAPAAMDWICAEFGMSYEVAVERIIVRPPDDAWTTEIRRALREAVEHWGQGRLDEAHRKFEEAFSKKPSENVARAFLDENENFFLAMSICRNHDASLIADVLRLHDLSR